MKKLNMKDFEFSQAHIHFWDKLERSNHFLEVMMERAELPVDDRTTHFMLGDPIGDGGQWSMAMNLIRKHGLVPKSAYPESHSSSQTQFMNSTLKEILRTATYEIRSKVEASHLKKKFVPIKSRAWPTSGEFCVSTLEHHRSNSIGSGMIRTRTFIEKVP